MQDPNRAVRRRCALAGRGKKNVEMRTWIKSIRETLQRDRSLPRSLLRALNLELEFQKLRIEHEWGNWKRLPVEFLTGVLITHHVSFPFSSDSPPSISTSASTSPCPCPPGPRPQTMYRKTSTDYPLYDAISSGPERTVVAGQNVHWYQILCRATDPRPLVIFRNL